MLWQLPLSFWKPVVFYAGIFGLLLAGFAAYVQYRVTEISDEQNGPRTLKPSAAAAIQVALDNLSVPTGVIVMPAKDDPEATAFANQIAIALQTSSVKSTVRPNVPHNVPARGIVVLGEHRDEIARALLAGGLVARVSDKDAAGVIVMVGEKPLSSEFVGMKDSPTREPRSP